VTPIQPITTLSEVYGPGLTFSGRASWRTTNLLRRGDPSVRDAFTGAFLTVAGTAELICSAGCLTPDGLALYQAAGLPVTTGVLPYAGAGQYSARLERAVATGRRLAFFHPHPVTEVPAESWWIAPALVTRLNDKGCLSEFVPAPFRPDRTVIPIQEAVGLKPEPGGVLVVKGSTDLPTGAGGAVVMVRDPAQLEQIPERLRGCSRVVIERYYPFVRTMCINWAVTWEGRLQFIGSADQIVSEEGVHLGNWAGCGFEPPALALEATRQTMLAAMAAGYVGLAGLDVGVTAEGEVLIIDLNFRPCASTPPLLWLDGWTGNPGGWTARIGTLRSSQPWAETCRMVARAAERGEVLPLATFVPEAAGWPDRQPHVRGAVLGRNRAETEARCEALARKGLIWS